MTNTELANSVRELADKIERLPEGTEVGIRPGVELRIHGIESLDQLRAVARIMGNPQANNYEGACWLKDESTAGVSITAFYRAGLLGERVVTEVGPDLSMLLEPSAKVTL